MTSTITQPKLRVDVKDQWVAALRSGDYKQGRTYLHHVTATGEHRFCCLGVLCDLAREAGVIVNTTPGGVDLDGRTRFEYDGLIGMPPMAVASWAFGAPVGEELADSGELWRVPDSHGDIDRRLVGRDQRVALIELNDTAGMSFADIADRIEEGL